MEKIIKEVDWNGKHYTFTNTFRNSGFKSHDVLTMTDNYGNSWTGETTWINRPWHRFDLEEAFTSIVGKAFGPKALELIHKINDKAYSVEDAIDRFFAEFKPEDIQANHVDAEDTSSEARIEALANYFEVDPEEIEEVDDNEFEINGKTYLVLTDEEADKEFEENVRNLWDELGLEAFGEFQDSAIEYCIDEDELKDYVKEDIENWVYEMSDEEVADELIAEGIYDSEDLYDEENDEWSPSLRDDVDFDELREELIENKLDNIDDLVDYLRDTGYDDDFFDNHIDDDKAVEALMDAIDANGSRGQEIAYYDGTEIELEGPFYAYRRD